MAIASKFLNYFGSKRKTTEIWNIRYIQYAFPEFDGTINHLHENVAWHGKTK